MPLQLTTPKSSPWTVYLDRKEPTLSLRGRCERQTLTDDQALQVWRARKQIFCWRILSTKTSITIHQGQINLQGISFLLAIPSMEAQLVLGEIANSSP